MRFSIINFSTMMLCFWCTPEETSCQTDFEKACLDRHNYFRKIHGVAPLKLDEMINGVSRQWANYLAKYNEFEHSGNRKYGENLYAAWSSSSTYTINGAAAVNSWYAEIKYYTNYKNEPSPEVMSKAGHYSQVVWKNTTKLGVGMARSATNNGVQYIVVCNYAPPGNWVGQFRKNVLPPK